MGSDTLLSRNASLHSLQVPQRLITQTGVDWDQLIALGTVVTPPIIIVGLAVRRYPVKGLTLGAVTRE